MYNDLMCPKKKMYNDLVSIYEYTYIVIFDIAYFSFAPWFQGIIGSPFPMQNENIFITW